MDHRLIMVFFSQLSEEFKIIIFSYLDGFIGWHQKPGDPFLGLTNLLQAFLKGSGCMLGSSEQTNLRNYFSHSHFKKALLSFGKMESPIEFICTYDFCSERLLSSYRLIGHLLAATAVSRGGTREKIDKRGWQAQERLSWLKGGRQGRGEEEQGGPFFAEVHEPSDGERQEGRVPPLPRLRPAGLLLCLRRHNQELPYVEVKCGWVRNKRGVSVVDKNEIEQEGSNENHNTVGNDESSETMNDLYNK